MKVIFFKMIWGVCFSWVCADFFFWRCDVFVFLEFAFFLWCEVFVFLEFVQIIFIFGWCDVFVFCFVLFYFWMVWGACFSLICALFFFKVWGVCFFLNRCSSLWCEVFVFLEFKHFFRWCEVFVFLEFTHFFYGVRCLILLNLCSFYFFPMVWGVCFS